MGIKNGFSGFLRTCLIGSLLLTSCSNEEDELLALDALSVDQEVKEFIWYGMNNYYYWKDGIPKLQEEQYDVLEDLYEHLESYQSPESFFASILHTDDPFSIIVSDYQDLENSFQGISTSFGYEFGLVQQSDGSIFGFVKYVMSSGPAFDSGLSRGDLFIKVNNTEISEENYLDLLLGNESVSLTLARFGDEMQDGLSETGEVIEMDARDLAENPILLSDVFELEQASVGYLVYNQFINNATYHEELNAVFGSFKQQGVSELILDLRYNPGGSVLTASALASMIYGRGTSREVFNMVLYNSNFESDSIFFLDELPSSGNTIEGLELDHVYILTSGSTASASELIISGLLPYMEVTLIGATTVGKNVGSVTLYDSPTFIDKEEINNTHTYAIQPIVSQFANANNFTDYIDGFNPNIAISELDYLNDLKPLGDAEEPLLSAALALIAGEGRITPHQGVGFIEFYDSKKKSHYLKSALVDQKIVSKTLREF